MNWVWGDQGTRLVRPDQLWQQVVMRAMCGSKKQQGVCAGAPRHGQVKKRRDDEREVVRIDETARQTGRVAAVAFE